MREIDALDGVMGRVIDRAGIQFRILNRSKGPAVRGPRAQADRRLYREAMQAALAEQPNLDLLGDAVEDLILGDDGSVAGVITASGASISAGAVILTTGTFLRGLIHLGEEKIPAGRVGEAPSLGLSETLSRAGFPLGPAEDRHAAASRWPDHRLGRAGVPAGRRSAAALLDPDRPDHDSPGALPRHLDHSAGP